jgi:formate hydrogenlyase subunit 3/multisubunit Na+/H+ antiporter MnhD subunit
MYRKGKEMSLDVLLVLIGWLFAVAIFFGFIILLRYIQHREHMELIKQGINPHNTTKQRRNRGMLRAGLITMMVGFSLTIGLYPLGFLLPKAFTNTPFHMGPWLLPGLIPLGVGAALTISYYLEQSSQPGGDDKSDKENVIRLQEHRTKGRQESAE